MEYIHQLTTTVYPLWDEVETENLKPWAFGTFATTIMLIGTRLISVVYFPEVIIQAVTTLHILVVTRAIQYLTKPHFAYFEEKYPLHVEKIYTARVLTPISTSVVGTNMLFVVPVWITFSILGIATGFAAKELIEPMILRETEETEELDQKPE